MSKSVVVTARVTEEQSELLDRVARQTQRSRAWLVSEAIDRYIRDETQFLAFVQEGIDDLENGRWIAHEDLMAELRETYGSERAA